MWYISLASFHLSDWLQIPLFVRTRHFSCPICTALDYEYEQYSRSRAEAAALVVLVHVLSVIVRSRSNKSNRQS